MDPVGREQLLALLLQGASDRMLSALAAVRPDDAADLLTLREELTDYALAASEPATPRSALRERLMATRPRPRRPKKPVLAVLDMLVDYLTPGSPVEVARAREIVPALTERIAEARRDGIPILYLCDRHEPDDPDFLEWPLHAVVGTEGANVWPALAPHPGDHVVPKPTYSAFTLSKLGPLLDELGADQIILTGCATEVGMLATATEALQRGFVVTIPPDCQAGMSMMTEQIALLTLSTMPPYHPRHMR